MTAKCVYPACMGPFYCKDLCIKHYNQSRRLDELKPVVDWKKLPCRVADCDRPSIGKMICRTHQTQKNRNGRLKSTALVPCWYPGCDGFGPPRAGHCRVHGTLNDKLKGAYGITLRERVTLAEAQGHVCKSCKDAVGVPYADGLVVDHCHDTGRVRGLLCNPCNLMLGLAKDRPERLRAAANYLEGDAC